MKAIPGSKEQTTLHIEYGDVEEFIREQTPFTKYCIPPNEECGNDTSIHVSVRPKDLDQWDKKEWEESGEDGWSYSLGVILNKLCFDGKIDPGIYIINVCW